MAIIRMRRPAPPGEIIRSVLPDMGLSPKGFARRLGETRRGVRELLTGRRGVTPELAERLAGLVGGSPGLWLRLQQAVDEWDRRHPRSPGPRSRAKPRPA